jgi:hypothetical protein
LRTLAGKAECQENKKRNKKGPYLTHEFS